MSFKARPDQIDLGYDATIGAATTGADYNDIQDAINAGKYNLLVLGTFTQPTQISNGSNFVEITIAERLKFTTVNFNIGSAGIRIRGGEIETAYTSGSVTLFTGTGTLDIADISFFDNSSGATVKLGQVSNRKHIVHNCKFVLPNNAACGFQFAGDGSSFTNLSVIGGGSSCKQFIMSAVDCIVDDIHFDADTFENGGEMIEIAAPSKGAKAFIDIAVVSNIVCEPGNNTMIISVDNSFAEVSNISGSISVECGSSNNHFANVNGVDLIFSGTNNNNLFVNCKFGGSTAISLGGDYNKVVDCDFNATFTLAAGSNNNQLLLCSSTGGFTDSGTDNAIIEEISDTVDGSSTNRQLADAAAIYNALHFRNVTTVNAATYDLLAADYILHVTYTTTGAVTSLTVPTAQIVDGRVIHIKDAGGNAGTNTITIDTEGSEKIDGQDSLVINGNYDSASLYIKDGNLFTF